MIELAGLDVYHIDRLHWDTKCLNVHGDWDGYEDGEAPYARHLEHGPADEPQNTWVRVPCTERGDYGGCGVMGEANARVMVEILEAIDSNGEYWCELTGGYSYHALYIRADIDEIDKDNQVVEAIGALENHPILCDDTHTEVEMEWRAEAWENYARADYVQELCKLHSEFAEKIEELPEKVIDELWYSAEEWGADLWRDENAYETMDCDIEKGASLTAATAITDAVLAEARKTIDAVDDLSVHGKSKFWTPKPGEEIKVVFLPPMPTEHYNGVPIIPNDQTHLAATQVNCLPIGTRVRWKPGRAKHSEVCSWEGTVIGYRGDDNDIGLVYYDDYPGNTGTVHPGDCHAHTFDDLEILPALPTKTPDERFIEEHSTEQLYSEPPCDGSGRVPGGLGGGSSWACLGCPNCPSKE